MIKHIVFFGLLDEAEGKTKAENALIIKSEIENLKSVIPQIKSIVIGINHPDAPAGNADIALVSEFESFADLAIYNNHPEHKRVAAFITKVRTTRSAVDYEM